MTSSYRSWLRGARAAKRVARQTSIRPASVRGPSSLGGPLLAQSLFREGAVRSEQPCLGFLLRPVHVCSIFVLGRQDRVGGPAKARTVPSGRIRARTRSVMIGGMWLSPWGRGARTGAREPGSAPCSGPRSAARRAACRGREHGRHEERGHEDEGALGGDDEHVWRRLAHVRRGRARDAGQRHAGTAGGADVRRSAALDHAVLRVVVARRPWCAPLMQPKFTGERRGPWTPGT